MEDIDEDLDLHAKKKKLLRLADERFLAGQTADLPKLKLQLRELKIDDIQLDTGRPRTEAYRLFIPDTARLVRGGSRMLALQGHREHPRRPTGAPSRSDTGIGSGANQARLAPTG